MVTQIQLQAVAIRLILVVNLSVFSVAAAQSSTNSLRSATNSATGLLTGRLVDTRNASVLVGRATVFLLDSRSGMPIDRETKQPQKTSFPSLNFDKLCFATTDEQGYFEFRDVAPGSYRLVAESWSGMAGFEGFSPVRKPSAYLILHGVAEDVNIEAGKHTTAYVRQLGQRVLRITNDPEEPHALLLISLKPTLGDAILGYYGWGTEFRQHLIGATQMEVGYVTIMGLPENATVHMGLMNYDNSPGFGAASYQPGQSTGQLRIVAGWSNGHHDPPPELKALTDYMDTRGLKSIAIEFGDLLKGAKNEAEALDRLLDEIGKDPERGIEVPGLGKQKLVDIFAAVRYAQMRAALRKRGN